MAWGHAGSFHVPRTTRTLISACLLVSLGIVESRAHPGRFDDNGCHYETTTGRYHCAGNPTRNRDSNAPAKKSRENVCHDRSSPNYSTLRYFVSYPSLQACLTSGGRAFGH
jgi:hypothetical protein